MVSGALMAKKKASKPKPDEMVTRALKMRQEYADWLDELSEFNRSTIAGLIDQALAEYAHGKGFRTPPVRTP